MIHSIVAPLYIRFLNKLMSDPPIQNIRSFMRKIRFLDNFMSHKKLEIYYLKGLGVKYTVSDFLT